MPGVGVCVVASFRRPCVEAFGIVGVSSQWTESPDAVVVAEIRLTLRDS